MAAFFHSNFILQDDHHGGLPPLQGDFCFSGKGSSSSAATMNGGMMCEDLIVGNHGEDELSDDGSQGGGEKKRRLNVEQVRTLEKNFELGNKLEAERKMQLARDLGLQPRQVAIWFQNRRARWKTKQLEKDYDLLKRQFEEAKAENDALLAQNQKLHAEILALKNTESINLNKGTTDGGGSSSDNNSSGEKIKAEITIDSSSSSKRNAITQQHSKPEISPVKEEAAAFCNIFCGVDDHATGGFWPWIEQQHNFS